MLPANSLLSSAHCFCKNALLLSTVSCEARDDNQREPSPGYIVVDQTLPIRKAVGASLLQLQRALECYEGQFLMTTFLFASSELSFVYVEESGCMKLQ